MNARFVALTFTVLAGEAIFMLPFMLPRLFRPLMLEGWGLTNTDFGQAYGAYGVCAMLSYLLGGPFADKYSPRLLLSISLVVTASLGLYFVGQPSAYGLIGIYAGFGVSTTLLMWSALIKTTHIAGGEVQRSVAMGILDGGRGLAAAIFSSLLVMLVTMTTPVLETSAQKLSALRLIYLATVGFTLIIAIGIWLSLKSAQFSDHKMQRWSVRDALKSLANVHVWLLSVVVLGAYCGFKSIDNFATYMVNVHKVSLSDSSISTSVIFWLRPIGAIGGGLLADRSHRVKANGRFMTLGLLLLLSGLAQISLAFAGEWLWSFAFALILLCAATAFAVRAIYFSVFGDLGIPNSVLGTTIGIVSFIGFTPDIFFGWITGRWIDANPDQVGFQITFLFTAVVLLLGAAASFALFRILRRR